MIPAVPLRPPRRPASRLPGGAVLAAALLLASAARGQAPPGVAAPSLAFPAREDSLSARRLLRETTPADPFWGGGYAGHGFARPVDALMALYEIAYPSLRVEALSLSGSTAGAAAREAFLEGLERFARDHPDAGARAAFLFTALERARAYRQEERGNAYYARLLDEHAGSPYVRGLSRYAPDRPIRIGAPAPPFAFASADSAGGVVTDVSLRGKTYLMDFWGTWCAPCLREMPLLHEAYGAYRDRGFEIVSVALDEAAAVRAFRSGRWPMPWPNVVLEEGDEQAKDAVAVFGIYGYPWTFLVGPDGRILAEGPEVRGEALLQTLERLLGAPRVP